ncbi:LuxR C-terminal-related transcriptional regulator [Lentzea sp. NPDC042327]|uniref:LuxR C-terminal-related transcriptional regulator n=1 Tax=Lentzea sp. NPDC042327 TaxID=3154801 RepID=UPI0033C351D1
MARFVVEMVFGPEHERLAGVRPAHRRYWEELAGRGVLLGGGPYADESGGLLLCEAEDDVTVRRLVAADPYVRGKLLRGIRIREWRGFLDGLPGPSGKEAEPQQSGIPMASRPSGSSMGSRALTAHEQRIATLIVDGRTNREIASRFRVSVRAVELHITSIYRKLGIHRRAQLAGALAA